MPLAAAYAFGVIGLDPGTAQYTSVPDPLPVDRKDRTDRFWEVEMRRGEKLFSGESNGQCIADKMA